MATLVTLEGPNAGKQFNLRDGCILVGRQPNSGIYLDSLAVSRQHAKIVRAEDAFFLEDLGSSNGTYVNGERVNGRVPLAESDTIQIGPYVLALRGASSTPRPGSESVVRRRVDASSANHTLYLQNPTAKLKAVLEISQHLARTLETEPLLGKLLDRLLRLFPQADRGLVVLCEGQRLVLRSFRARRPHVTEVAYSRTVVQRALSEGVGLLSEDVPGDPRLIQSATLIGLQLRSFLCVPLLTPEGRRLGVIQLDCTTAGMAFDEEDLEVLTAVAQHVAVVLENATLHAARVQEERLRQELALAREIQQGYLPTDFRPVSGNYELYARVHAAREVSGDLYDFFPLADGRLVFLVGDVSGKGMPAALFLVAVRTLLRHLAAEGKDPATTLARLNDSLALDNPSCMFATVCLGIYDPSRAKVTLASGGHMPPLWARTSGLIEEVPVRPGRLLGYPGGNLGLTNTVVTLEPQETLLLYTDGFTEARANAGDAFFGLERLRETLAESIRHPLAQCADALKDAVVRFGGRGELHDDLTVLLLRHAPPLPEVESVGNIT